MPDKSISERLDDCETIQGDLQTELVSHSRRLDALSKRIEVQEEATKQFQSDLRQAIQDLMQLEALNNQATNAPRNMLPKDGQAVYDKIWARLLERYRS